MTSLYIFSLSSVSLSIIPRNGFSMICPSGPRNAYPRASLTSVSEYVTYSILSRKMSCGPVCISSSGSVVFATTGSNGKLNLFGGGGTNLVFGFTVEPLFASVELVVSTGSV